MRKLGWYERLFNTPSQHRVHHAVNPRYLDRNYAATLCIWDRLFGTFQEERAAAWLRDVHAAAAVLSAGIAVALGLWFLRARAAGPRQVTSMAEKA